MKFNIGPIFCEKNELNMVVFVLLFYEVTLTFKLQKKKEIFWTGGPFDLGDT
jgi:hypothetical protein